MIAVEQLNIKQGSFSLLDISFEIPSGSYGILMGRTGSGKTSILETICGLRRAASGRIIIGEKDVTDLKPAERGIGFVPQDGALFETMTVGEHLAFALVIRKWPKPQISERIEDLAAWLRLDHLLDRKPQGLSGGEAQRVAFGRALSFHPQILLLDEPMSSLDEETRDEMYDLLATVRERTQVTTLHITHSTDEASRLADFLYRIDDGKVVRK